MEHVTGKVGNCNRRQFMQMVAVAGTAAGCWQLGLLGTGKLLQTVRKSRPIMGTVLNLTVYGPDRDACEEALTATMDEMLLLETHLSRHMVGSELSELNMNGRLARPSSHLFNVLSLSENISRKTSGAFDVTMLPLLQMHKAIHGNNGYPGTQEVTGAKRLVGYVDLHLSRDKIYLGKEGMRISLDGIGKGYIVDHGVSILRRHGFTNVYVEAGGDLMVTGHKNLNSSWRIGLRPPRRQQVKPVVIQVTDKAVATSGDYLQAFTPDLKHHHIIHPASGFSPQELSSCTVTAPNVALADGLATAVMVLGKNDGLDLISSMQGCEGYVVDKNLNSFNTAGFFA